MSIELKIKSKHLTLEAKVIRFEEAKLKKQIDWLERNESKSLYEVQRKLCSLSDHRKFVVGRENRATFLARAYITGTPYLKVEASRRDDKHYEFICKVLPRVLEMVKKYHPSYEVRKTLTMDKLKEWCI